jgi:hypothetical protein
MTEERNFNIKTHNPTQTRVKLKEFYTTYFNIILHILNFYKWQPPKSLPT